MELSSLCVTCTRCIAFLSREVNNFNFFWSPEFWRINWMWYDFWYCWSLKVEGGWSWRKKLKATFQGCSWRSCWYLEKCVHKLLWVYSTQSIQCTLYRHDCTNCTPKLLFYLARETASTPRLNLDSATWRRTFISCPIPGQKGPLAEPIHFQLRLVC